MQRVDLSKANDVQLLTRYVQGRDQRGFAELIRRHGPMVSATVRRVLRNHEDCQDAVQATFFALAKGAEKVHKKSALGGWLHRTAYRSACEIRRLNTRNQTKVQRMTRQLTGLNGQPNQNNDPSCGIANAELNNILDEEIDRLPTHLRIAVILCELEGVSKKDAATQLGIAPSTLTERLSKAFDCLRRAMSRRNVVFSVAGLTACVSSSSDSVAAMSSQTITDLAMKASKYAAGHSAAELGVSTSVVTTANKAILAMTTLKLLAVALLTTAILLFAGSIYGLVDSDIGTANAGTIFFDDFDDGDYTSGDATWTIAGTSPGFLSVSDGKFTISRNADSFPSVDVAADADNVLVKDVSVRTRARPTKSNSVAAINVRTQTTDETSGYFAAVGYDALGQGFLTAGIVLPNNKLEFFADPSVSVNHDVRNGFTDLQIDAIGDEIRIWAWEAGKEMPDSPQYNVTDKTYTEAGIVRLVAPRIDTSIATGGEAIFDFVHAADMPIHEIVPEPASAALGLVLTGLAIATWRRRL